MGNVGNNLRFAVQSTSTTAACVICGRTLLLGEYSRGHFTSDGVGPYDVCELCFSRAPGYDLSPSEPEAVPESAGRTARNNPVKRLLTMLSASRSSSPPPGLTGWSAVVPALARLQGSDHLRTIMGLRRTLGTPLLHVQPEGPQSENVVLTCTWEIRWYQFIITPEAISTTHGNDAHQELPVQLRQKNCLLDEDGRFSLLTAHNIR